MARKAGVAWWVVVLAVRTIPLAESAFKTETWNAGQTVVLRRSLASHTERIAVQAVILIQVFVRKTDDRHTGSGRKLKTYLA